MADKIKLLWLSDSPFSPTGYRNQSINLMMNLVKKNYDIDYLANGWRLPDPMFQEIVEEAIIRDTHVNNVKLKCGLQFDFKIHWHKAPIGTPNNDLYFRSEMNNLCKSFKPDIQGTLLDLFMLYPFYLNEWDTAPAKRAFWFPSDGGRRLPKGCEEMIKRIDIPVAMAKFGQRQVKKIHNLNTHYIPHAINHKQFFPLEEKEKQELRLKWGLKNKFVVGAVFRNQPRKMADGLFKSFAKFCKSKEDAVLLCHCDPNDGAALFDLRLLAQDLGILNRVRFTGMTIQKSFPDTEMNNVYNLMDIQISSTSGEGFGLCTAEGFACEVPMIITDYTTSQELVNENGQCGEVVDLVRELTGNWNVERGIYDIDDGQDKLEVLYNNSEVIKKYGKIGRKKVIENYNWKDTTDSFDKLFRKNLEEQ